MATVRIQLRRGTASEWFDADPVLEAGEAGFETDTGKFKIGDGSTTWIFLPYAADRPSDISNMINDLDTQYIQLSEKGNVDGVAELGPDGYVPDSQIAPTITRDSELTAHNNATTSVHGISNTADLATKNYADNAADAAQTAAEGYADSLASNYDPAGSAAAAQTAAEGYADSLASNYDPAGSAAAAQTAAEGYTDTQITNLVNAAPSTLNTLKELADALGSDPNYATTISTELGNKQDKVSGVSDTEIGYLDGVTSSIQTQINGKISASSSDTLTNKGISLTTNTVSGTLAEFNSALSDENFATISGSETLSNKTLLTPTVASFTNANHNHTDSASGGTLTSLAITDFSEAAQDAANSAITAGTGISKSYDDENNTLTISNTGVTSLTGTANEVEVSGSTGSITVGLPNDVTIAGNLTLSNEPTQANHAATKAYVDNTTAGINFHAPAHAATTANLSATYSNGTSGVGATLTANSNGAIVIDGHTLSVADRVLVKDQSTGFQNGLYTVTATGDGSNPWVLTRATDADNSPAGEVAYGDFVFVQNGSTNAGFGFIVNTTGTITIGTTSISYVQFNAGQTVTAGNGLTESSPGTLAINTGVTVDLSTSQTLTNKTITGSFTGNLTGNADTVTNGVYTTDTGTVTSTMIANGTIVNEDINASAAISATKISGTAVTQADTGTVTNTMLAGSIANAKLANSSVTIGSTSVSLGSTAGTIGGLTLTSPVISTISNTGSLTLPTSTDTLVGKATTDIFTNKTFDTAGTGNVLKINGTQVSNITGTGSVVLATSPSVTGLSTDTINTTGNVTIGGDLTVNGTTVTVNSTTVTVDDKNLELGSVATPTDTTANGGGITLKGATDKTFNWVSSTTSWTSSENLDLASGKVIKINGTQVLSGSALGSGITSSSLTSVGTITSGTWNGSVIGAAYIDTAITRNLNTYVTDATAARTIASATDKYNVVTMSYAGAIAVTVPSDANDAGWAVGSYVTMRATGANGQITVSAGAGATLVATDSQFKSRVQYSQITLEKIAANTWLMSGDTTA